MPHADDVRFEALDGRPMNGFLAEPRGDALSPGLVVIHEIYGLNGDIRRIARRFADSGYAAFAPDLYDRVGPRAFCVARTVANLKSGRGQAFDDIEAARRYLAARPGVDGDRLGVVGFCMGGGFALLAALEEPYRVAAPFYGDVPKDAEALDGICPVVGGFGGRDRMFAPQGRRLKRHLRDLDVAHDVEIYEDAGHSYMSRHRDTLMVRFGARGPMKAGYHEVAAEDSWRRMLAFFDEHLAAPEK